MGERLYNHVEADLEQFWNNRIEGLWRERLYLPVS